MLGSTNCRSVHYCTVCSARFPDDEDKFPCATEGCNGYRYRGLLSSQMKNEKQPTTTGSWKGRGNQYIQFVRVLYCKLPTNGKQLPAFPLKAITGIEPRPRRWEASVTTLPPWPPYTRMKKRVCCIVRFKNGEIREILFFLVNVQTNSAMAYGNKVDAHPDNLTCDNFNTHIVQVAKTKKEVIFYLKKIFHKYRSKKLHSLHARQDGQRSAELKIFCNVEIYRCMNL